MRADVLQGISEPEEQAVRPAAECGLMAGRPSGESAGGVFTGLWLCKE